MGLKFPFGPTTVRDNGGGLSDGTRLSEVENDASSGFGQLEDSLRLITQLFWI